MAYEHINVASLKESLLACKNSINYKDTSTIITEISNNSTWEADAKTPLKNGMTILTEQRYKELENKLDSYIGIANTIEQYQTLAKENQALETEYASLSTRLNKTEEYTEKQQDKSSGETISVKKTREVIDTDVENQMKQNREKLNSNIQEQTNLQNIIENSI